MKCGSRSRYLSLELPYLGADHVILPLRQVNSITTNERENGFHHGKESRYGYRVILLEKTGAGPP